MFTFLLTAVKNLLARRVFASARTWAEVEAACRSGYTPLLSRTNAEERLAARLLREQGMRRKSVGDFCRQHASKAGTAPGSRKHTRQNSVEG